MSDYGDPRRKNGPGPEGAQGASPNEPPRGAPTALDEEKVRQQAIAETIHNILRGIPIFGPYVVLVKLKFGWSGILLCLGGFLLAVVLVYLGLLPSRVVGDRYKATPTSASASAGDGGYVLESNPRALLAEAVSNAQSSVDASGIALVAIDPGAVAGRVRAGVNVNLFYTDPCASVICNRMRDEGTENAQGNIHNQLARLNGLWRQFKETEKTKLHVNLVEDVYPTMIVAVIDNRDLYAYFCPHGDNCTASPVLVFRGYKEGKRPPNDAALFFEKHLNSVRSKAKPLDFSRYDFARSCPCPSPTPSEALRPAGAL
jgi:hypothetical protein